MFILAILNAGDIFSRTYDSFRSKRSPSGAGGRRSRSRQSSASRSVRSSSSGKGFGRISHHFTDNARKYGFREKKSLRGIAGRGGGGRHGAGYSRLDPPST
jgi:hypothetical protein